MNSSIVCIVLLFTISTVPTHGSRISSNVPTVVSSGTSTPQYNVTKVNQNNQVTEYEDADELTAGDINYDTNLDEEESNDESVDYSESNRT
ncbi:Protein VHS3 [Schistosoma japonicum]|nr:Protein VHS3 [Schistosoma japonicum]